MAHGTATNDDAVNDSGWKDYLASADSLPSEGQKRSVVAATLVPGATRKQFTSPKGKTVERLVMGENAKPMDLPPLKGISAAQFFVAIDTAIDALREATENR